MAVQWWDALGAISGCVATLTVIVALFFARRQISEAKLARDAQVLQVFQDRYHSKERRSFRQRIRNGEFGPAELFDRKKLSEEDDTQFGILIDELEFLAILVDRELLDFDLVVAAFRNTPVKIWRYVEPSIRAHRRNAPDPVLGIHLEKLAQRYDQHYRKNYGIPHPAFTEPVYGTAPVAPPTPTI
jgi:hypothetical protein